MPISCLSSRDIAGRWFLESGIQNSSGGVARYYRPDQGRNEDVSTEITGYTVSTLTYLHSVTGDPRYLDAALRAGRYLTRSAWDASCGAFPFEYALNGAAPSRLSYFFDSGIILRGLLLLWRVTSDTEFLDAASACGKHMASDFAGLRVFHPVITLPEKKPEAGDARWSRNPGCYQLKATLGFLELAEETGRQEFIKPYERVLEYSLQTHTSFLPETADAGTMDRLHAYAYFLEGLLPRAGEFRSVLLAGLERAARMLSEIAPVFERSDVRAQLFRVRLFADKLGLVPFNEDNAEAEVRRILEFQREHADSRIHGGFWFGRKGEEMVPYVNPASSAFCVQAVQMWESYRSGEFVPDWRILI